jgi:MFS family permease
MKKFSLFPIYTVLFADNFGFGLAFTLFANLILSPYSPLIGYETSLTFKNLLLAGLFGIFPLTQLFGAPILGNWADQRGRKSALTITLLGTCIGYLFSAFSISIHSVPLLVASRAVTGFFSGNMSICLAVIADLSIDAKERARNYGFAEAIPTLGWTIGMIAGGIGWNSLIPLWMAAGITLLSFILIIKIFKETHLHRQKGKFDPFLGMRHILPVFRDKATCYYYLVFFFWVTGWGALDQWFVAFSIEKFSVHMHSLIFWLVLAGLGWSLGTLLINPFLLKNRTSYAVCLIGFLLTTLFSWAASFSSSYFLFASLFTLANVFSGFAMTNTLNLISISSSNEVQGKALGISQSISSVGKLLAAIAPVFLIGTSILWIYPAASLLLTAAFLLLLISKL